MGMLSGRGSNLAQLLAHQEHYRISAIVSNRSDCPGLSLAEQYNIPAFSFDRSSYASLTDFKSAIRKKLLELNPDIIALAGYMQLLEPEFITAFSGRIINIHPSLLPSFPGLDTHARAIASGCQQHGCTVHYVDAGVDTGPVIAQASVTVDPGDDATLLAARVLKREHEIYPWVLNEIALGNIYMDAGAVSLKPSVLHSAREKDFIIPE